MACAGYSKTSLMGNWYEERLAHPQKMREDPEARFLREEEGSIAFMTNNNKLMPLPRHKRVPKWETKQLIPDDTFREFRSITKTSFDPLILTNYKSMDDRRPFIKTGEKSLNYPEFASTVLTSGPKHPTMLASTNFNREITDKVRDVKMAATDFGSTFKKHDSEHQRFYNVTSYQQAFSKPETHTPNDFVDQKIENAKRFAGFTLRSLDQTGKKINSTLTGELYKNQIDPENNTHIQRSWLPYKDTGLDMAQKNIATNTMRNSNMGLSTVGPLSNYRKNLSQELPYDIATSLPMEGEQCIMFQMEFIP